MSFDQGFPALDSPTNSMADLNRIIHCQLFFYFILIFGGVEMPLTMPFFSFLVHTALQFLCEDSQRGVGPLLASFLNGNDYNGEELDFQDFPDFRTRRCG